MLPLSNFLSNAPNTKVIWLQSMTSHRILNSTTKGKSHHVQQGDHTISPSSENTPPVLWTQIHQLEYE